MERRDLVIVGGGPAGAATALALGRIAPDLAERALILDRAHFPRDKTCAGGLIPHTLGLLRELGLGLDVPHVRVDTANVEAGGGTIAVASDGCCWVIRRLEFDAFLLDAARSRGTEVREGVGLRSISRAGDRLHLETDAGPIECRAVVGADGSGSLVRRRLVDAREGWVARASMCDVPALALAPPPPEDRIHYEFDFRPTVAEGLQGYLWSFPCLIAGRPHWNVGVYSLKRAGEGARIGHLLDARAACASARRHAHAIRLYQPRAPLSGPGALLVGDAAGVDPLLGEGISYALEYGMHAANALANAFRRDDLSFRSYGRAIRTSPMGRKLSRLALMARLFYGPRRRFWFGMARLSRRAQRMGMDWYNGVAA